MKVLNSLIRIIVGLSILTSLVLLVILSAQSYVQSSIMWEIIMRPPPTSLPSVPETQYKSARNFSVILVS